MVISSLVWRREFGFYDDRGQEDGTGCNGYLHLLAELKFRILTRHLVKLPIVLLQSLGDFGAPDR